MMQIISLDFETFFDKRNYTLKKMTTESFIRDPRFEADGCAIKWGPNKGAVFYTGDQLPMVFDRIDWARTAVVCHHAHFDGLILSHHYKRVPAKWFCTLSMARAVLGNHIRVGLDALASAYNLAAKSVPYDLMDGKRWSEMDAATKHLVAMGACHDVELTWVIAAMLMRGFPAEELELIDMTVRMFTEPALLGDMKLLGEIWHEERKHKRDLAERYQIDPALFRSNAKFAEYLETQWDVEVEYKEGKHGEIPALAKNDSFIQDILVGDDEELAELVQARIDSKSSIIQSRAATLGNMAMRGALCIYLYYCGAHTKRWSGGDRANLQNLRRGHKIRKSLVAPEHQLIAVPDQSQIECRILNFLAGQIDVIERFRAGADPYTTIASQFYGRAITKEDEAERGTGKQAELSCGYGCGWKKFKRTARLGTYGPPVILSDEQAQRGVSLYRQTHASVCRYWSQADQVLGVLANGGAGQWGPMHIADGRITLPNGLKLDYTTLKWRQWKTKDDVVEQGWTMRTRDGVTKMYGAKLVEQSTQALARVTAGQAMLRIGKAGLRCVGMSHDEAWVTVPQDQGGEAAAFCAEEMKRVPDWLPGIPLDAEVKVGKVYPK